MRSSIRLALLVGTVIAVVVAGIAAAASTAEPPANRGLPWIGGTARVGQILTTRNGSWAGTRPLAFSYQWRRCGQNGGNCADIAGAVSRTYAATSADVGHRLRVLVTVKNAAGGSSAVSRESAIVRARSAPAPAPAPPPGPAGQVRLPDGKISIPVTSVAPPQRLVISSVSFSPNPVVSRTPFTGRFRVTDTRGYAVRGAVVFALGVPYNRILQEPEQATGDDGYVTFTFRPTASLPLSPGNDLVVFLRARKATDNLLAGVSTRRLVQVALG